jgi:site-specific recombinase XerD
MHRLDVLRMIQRRTRDAGIATELSCHSFRATGITVYLKHGGLLEHAQKMAAHASAKTTKLYDRREDGVTLDEIEKIVL